MAGRALRVGARLAGHALLGAWTAVCVLAVAPRAWGLVLGLAATAAAVTVLTRGSRRLGFCLGWAGVLAVVLPQRPEGDLVIAADTAGWTLLGAAFLVLVAGVATLPAPARSRGRGVPPT